MAARTSTAASSTSPRAASPPSPPPRPASSTSRSSGRHRLTHGRREILDLLDTHGIRPSRALGQNFVADPNTVRRIARLAEVGPGDRVVEIGAGLGSLTLALVETGAAVTAVELDRRLAEALRTIAAPLGVEVVEGDALRLDWPGLLAGADPWALVANLPYNVATPLVLELLERAPTIERMLVMVQREVGERLAAPVRSDPYGAVSVKVAWWASARVVGRVPRGVFVPEPKVESALVEIRRRPLPATVGPTREAVFSLVEAGFGQRRKMLRRALGDRVTQEQFAAAAVAPEARAEELDLDAWCRLAACASSPTPS
ncbi:MAG TPA: 16S rRNA (adenine(1518)-N(6)/adenine(1519)-N(6))-dimethyltransferase RsmA [Acidimicrobiales bacterium]|nr:16S rRNA (adenine(1518)-N(6)/adenine(1519)-N(6))-dimethyltransferase RsmA [Acidimicrobiales bacterium]